MGHFLSLVLFRWICSHRVSLWGVVGDVGRGGYDGRLISLFTYDNIVNTWYPWYVRLMTAVDRYGGSFSLPQDGRVCAMSLRETECVRSLRRAPACRTVATSRRLATRTSGPPRPGRPTKTTGALPRGRQENRLSTR